MQRTIILFYSLQVKPKDPKRDLIWNLSANFILSDEVYFLLFNLYSIYHQKTLFSLTQIMKDKDFLAQHINLDTLKIKHQFKFDKAFKSKY